MAEKVRLESMPPRGYQAIEGLSAYNQAVQTLLFGKESPLLTNGQVTAAEAIVARAHSKSAQITQTTTSQRHGSSVTCWENHRALFEAAGFPVETYPYYDAPTASVSTA